MLLINNPILKREFTSSARSLRTNLLLGGYLFILAFVLVSKWPDGGIYSVASESGREIFRLFFSINMTLLLLLVPAFSATSITFEKENNTFASLFTTLMSPFEIMFGKLSASIVILVFFVLFSIPISSICALTGGISISFMIKVNSILLITAVSYGLLGLACSSICVKSSSAIILNYVLILLFAGASWLPDVLLRELIGFHDTLQIIKSFSPYDSLFYLIYPESYRIAAKTASATGAMNPFNVFIIFSAVLSFISFLIFSKNVLNPSGRKSKTVEMYTGTKKTIKRKLSWPFYLIDPLKRKKNIKRWSNPVFVAEMRSKLFANPKFVARIVSLIFILSLGLICLVATQVGSSFESKNVNLIAIVFQISVVALLAPSVSSGLITDEITAGTLMPLRMTPISPFKMVSGKLKATFFYALIFIISSLFVVLAMAYLVPQELFPPVENANSGNWWSMLQEKISQDPNWYGKLWDTYWRLVMWVVILLLSTITFLTGGLFSSCISRKTSVATAISYSIAAVICLVSFAPLVMKMSHGVSMFIMSFNPIAAAMQIMSGSEFQQFPGLWKNNIMALSLLTVFFLMASVARTWYLFNHRD